MQKNVKSNLNVLIIIMYVIIILLALLHWYNINSVLKWWNP